MERSLGLLIVILIAAANASTFPSRRGGYPFEGPRPWSSGPRPWSSGHGGRDTPLGFSLRAHRRAMMLRPMVDHNSDESSEEMVVPIQRIIEDPVHPTVTDMTNTENKGTIDNQINTLKQLLEVTKQESEQKINALRKDSEAAKRETEQKIKGFQQQMEALKQESELKAKVMRQKNRVQDEDPKKNGFEGTAPKVTMKQRTQTVETEIKIEYNSAIEDNKVISSNEDNEVISDNEDKEVISDNEDEEASTCPNNFVSLDGRCYHFTSVAFGSWLDGLAACSNLDSKSSLISLESQEEWDTIKEYITRHKLDTKNWYLGGSDMDEEGTWRWTDTNRTFEFSDWCRGEPNDYNNEDCAMITAVSEWYNWDNRLCWSDMNCHSIAGFKRPLHSICEIVNKALND